MAANPIIEETSAGRAAASLAALEPLAAPPPLAPERLEALEPAEERRRLAIYAASAGYELVEELSHLANRAIEPNIFFNPRFLAPAMPRLEDREVRLAVIRDGASDRSRLRLLVPFTVERQTPLLGVPVLRTWSSPYSPLGVPLLDRDDPAGVLEDFFAMLARPHLGLPKVFVFPDILLDGPFAGLLRLFALDAELPMATAEEGERPFHFAREGEPALAASGHHMRGFARLRRRLSDLGQVEHRVARSTEEVRLAVEDFLALEVAGWKGRSGTAMASDRLRAAFLREAAERLANADMCRVHSLLLDDRVMASLIVFVESGRAYTWKTTYDEAYASYSPGTMLMVEATRWAGEDPNIEAVDSCAVPEHPVMSRLWSGRRPVGTIIVGLSRGAERATRQAARQLDLARGTRNFARQLRDQIGALTRRR